MPTATPGTPVDVFVIWLLTDIYLEYRRVLYKESDGLSNS
jgi:hypothetical protein